MATILETICERKREEVAALRRTGIREERRTAVRPFLSALQASEGVALIAEIKKASPSRGLIRKLFDPQSLAVGYERGGADCLSVLTDREFFQGSAAYLQQARAAVSLPVLRKEFIIDALQIEESYCMEADAILLITAVLEQSRLEDFHRKANALGLAVLVEVHNEEEMERAIGLEAPLIGINNRNLHDFSVSLETTERLSRLVPENIMLVSESGIYTQADIARVGAAGAGAVLVGESLMREEDVTRAARLLLTGHA